MGSNLLEMIMAAQGGAAAQNAGQSLGLDASQTQSAVTALLPAISSALKQNTKSPEGLAGLLKALQSGHHEQYIENPNAIAQESTIQDGNAILGHLFGSKDVSRAVAGRAAEQSGLSQDLMKKMLPMVAAMAMGSLSKQTNAQDMKSQLAGLAMSHLMGGGQKPGGGLGNIIGGILGGGRRKQQAAVQQQASQQHQQGLGMLGKMLDADGDGNMMDDILQMAMNSRR